MPQQPALPRDKFTAHPYGDKFASKFAARPSPSTGSDRHTYYVVLQVEGSGRGIAYDFEEIDADAPDQFATLALLGRTKDGRLRGITYKEFSLYFWELLEEAANRAGVFPKPNLEDSVASVYRHKER